MRSGSFSVLYRVCLLGLSLLLASCQYDAYCLQCGADGVDAHGSVDTGNLDGGSGRDTGNPLRIDVYVPPVDAGDPADAACMAGAPEECNNLDDDCDMMVDEGVDLSTIQNCGACNRPCNPPRALGECVSGMCTIPPGNCDPPYYDQNGVVEDGCEYRCAGSEGELETCDRRDNDCDFMTDETFDLQNDPMNCGTCLKRCDTLRHTTATTCSMGACRVVTCEDGYVDADGIPANGCEYRCTPTGAETCDGRDNDCNGMVDEGDPGGGVPCGDDTGECAAGTSRCDVMMGSPTRGTVVCDGETRPSPEVCDGLDNDCDGMPDDGNPGGGATCGNSMGVCIPGRETCMGGTLQCVGGTQPGTETCNALDDDCDGSTDERNAGGGGACGVDTGACVAGVEMCQGGALRCMGQVGPVLETCNMVDDDCDGMVDDGFSLMTDPRNCGMCGRICNLPNAVEGCMGGNCTVLACEPGYVNLDGMIANGCEYRCDINGAEQCNGRDDDCDMRTDEGLTPPAICNPNGVCAGTMPACMGMAGWVCSYTNPAYQPSGETRCDNLDNDCNGLVDEPFPLRMMACNNGQQGACRRMGMWVCNSAQDNVECNAPSGMSSMSAEVCDGIDNNCDGMLDNGAPTQWVQFTSGSNTRWIMAYEASRPNASMSSAGNMTHRVCSEPNRLPWTQVTYTQAQAACQTVGGRLCTETEWEDACDVDPTGASGGPNACYWADGQTLPGCQMHDPTTCNGNAYDTTPGGMDDDAVLPTGSLPMCYARIGAAANQRVFDMSGNVEEWTTARSPGVNPVRGGSTNDAAGGLRCNANFIVASDTFQIPTVGFRCCRDTAP